MIRSHRGPGAVFVLALLVGTLLLAGLPLLAQDDEPFPDDDEQELRYRLGLEIRTHYRDSDETRFPSPFPFPTAFLPPGETQAFMETVEAGSHVEVSVVTVEGLARWREDLEAKVKIDFIDRYDRNPTSEDRDVDVDEAWLRFGREAEPADVPERRGWYAKLGKFGKFERQDDRHLESYGHVATAFNRFEDVGLEVGVDLTRNLYVKASLTHGNPVFFRDSNSLAGDNGLGSPSAPVIGAKTGLPILYDADVDTIDFSHPELGVGLGYRWSSISGFAAFDLLAWGYERELADEAPLGNTFYGGDLDLFSGPPIPDPADPSGILVPRLPYSGDEKKEVGANLWLYLGGFTFFGQWVDSEAAKLGREGFEVEVSWAFDLPWGLAVGSRQLFSWIAPAVRYSELDADFRPIGPYPAPSVAWDWEKLDLGLAFGVIDELDVTVEWTDNTFVLFNGSERSHDEFLVTLRLALEKRWPRL